MYKANTYNLNDISGLLGWWKEARPGILHVEGISILVVRLNDTCEGMGNQFAKPAAPFDGVVPTVTKVGLVAKNSYLLFDTAIQCFENRSDHFIGDSSTVLQLIQ